MGRCLKTTENVPQYSKGPRVLLSSCPLVTFGTLYRLIPPWILLKDIQTLLSVSLPLWKSELQSFLESSFTVCLSCAQYHSVISPEVNLAISYSQGRGWAGLPIPAALHIKSEQAYFRKIFNTKCRVHGSHIPESGGGQSITGRRANRSCPVTLAAGGRG